VEMPKTNKGGIELFLNTSKKFKENQKEPTVEQEDDVDLSFLQPDPDPPSKKQKIESNTKNREDKNKPQSKCMSTTIYL
jgi:hypothetical protein